MSDKDPLMESELGDTGELVIDDLANEHVMDFQEEPVEEQPEPEEEAEPEEKEEAEEKEEPAEKPEKAETDKPAGKEKVAPIEEDQIKWLPGGKDATIKVKGKEYKLSEFKPDEVKTFLQLGLRGTQRFQEVAEKERQLAEKEATLNAVADRVNLLQQQLARGGAPSLGTTTAKVELPKELAPNDMDSEEMRVIKSAAAQSWTRSQELAQRLDQIEGRTRSQQDAEAGKAFVDNISKMKEADYPNASLEEVIAIHSLRPDIPVREIVKKSHEIYSSRGHIDNVLKTNPLLRRELKEEMVAEYLAEKQRKPTVSGRPSPQGGKVAPAPAHKAPRTIEEANKMAKARLRELVAAEEEEA